MRLNFVYPQTKAERMVCEVELVFEPATQADSWEGSCPTCGSTAMLAGMKLVGFSVWKSPEGELYVTFPSRAFGAGGERKYFDFLRGTGTPEGARRVKRWILAEFHRQAKEDDAPVKG